MEEDSVLDGYLNNDKLLWIFENLGQPAQTPS